MARAVDVRANRVNDVRKGGCLAAQDVDPLLGLRLVQVRRCHREGGFPNAPVVKNEDVPACGIECSLDLDKFLSAAE
jgi:hypothetical protein